MTSVLPPVIPAPAPAARYPQQLNELIQNTKERGGIEGAKRLEFIRSQYKQLTPYTAYLWLNPEDIQEEIESAKVNHWGIHTIHYLRNIFSLLPLIITWGGLYDAVSAYQRDLAKNPADNTIPFLQLWQSSFHGSSLFPFTTVAILDIVCLCAYLASLLIIHRIEQAAHTSAVRFIDSKEWREPIQALMDAIDEVSKPFITDKSDIETVVGSVKSIVDEATLTLKATAKEIAKDVQASAEMIAATNLQVVEKTSQSLQDFVQHAWSSINQVTASSEEAMKKVVAISERAVTETLERSKQAIITSNTKVETLFDTQVQPLIETFNRDILSLQQELRNYQGRLDGLTKAGEQLASSSLRLADASSALEENAERYVIIGTDLKTQIAALSTVQQDMLSQFNSVASNISTAAGNMTDTQVHMAAAIHGVNQLTRQLEHGMEHAMDAISTRIERTSQSLEGIAMPLQATSQSLQRIIPSLEASSQSFQRVIPPLEETSQRLYFASQMLASIRVFPFIRKRRTPPQQQGRVS
jgi:hypothetical protein